ncbi:MAG: hypothetical protein JXB04_07260 [Kiritimatiellae bacterium]|nr:hypothetical protein [Kiritimatiellia bacterium]
MKRCAIFALLLAAAVAAHAIVLSQGNKELAIEGLFDSTSLDGDHYDFTFFYGEYPEDNTEIALQASARGTDHVKLWSAGVRFEQNFTQYTVVPFLALSLEYARVDVSPNEDRLTPDEFLLAEDVEEDAFVAGGHAGLKWFLAENVAVAGSFVYEWASNDVFEDEDGELSDSNASVRFGMRFLF